MRRLIARKIGKSNYQKLLLQYSVEIDLVQLWRVLRQKLGRMVYGRKISIFVNCVASAEFRFYSFPSLFRSNGYECDWRGNDFRRVRVHTKVGTSNLPQWQPHKFAVNLSAENLILHCSDHCPFWAVTVAFTDADHSVQHSWLHYHK